MTDPFDLDRFVRAQEDTYAQALAEIRAGRKRTHWMWFVFPQIAGLGSSPMAERYAIESLAEARAYLQHAVLGPSLVECSESACAVDGRSAIEIFGTPDDLKLRSSATLFDAVSAPGSVFDRLLRNSSTASATQRRSSHQSDRLSQWGRASTLHPASHEALCYDAASSTNRGRRMPKFVIERDIPGHCGLERRRAARRRRSSRTRSFASWGRRSSGSRASSPTTSCTACTWRRTKRTIREHARRAGFPANRISAVRELIDPTTGE